jgi:hypothetical protein
MALRDLHIADMVRVGSLRKQHTLRHTCSFRPDCMAGRMSALEVLAKRSL